MVDLLIAIVGLLATVAPIFIKAYVDKKSTAANVHEALVQRDNEAIRAGLDRIRGRRVQPLDRPQNLPPG